MFGRKHKMAAEDEEAGAPSKGEDVQPDAIQAEEDGDESVEGVDTADKPADEADDESATAKDDEDEADDRDVPDEDEPDEADEDDEDEDDTSDEEEPDWRADGPFDYDEVELSGDAVQRVDLGSLIVTPFDGLSLQLQVHQDTKQAGSVTAVWQKSGLEVALFAASAGSDLASEFRDDVIDEAAQAGGTATVEDGPFGPQVHRVVPQQGSNGEQLFHVSRIWLVEGPRWLLRGTLLGPAAAGEVDNPDSAPFIEFFRNLVVRRGGKPMVPGDPIALDVPVPEGGE